MSSRNSADHFSRDLAGFTGKGYDKGRGVAIQILWLLASTTFFVRWWCPNRVRIRTLRVFGARIGNGVLVRHGVKIHWPWKLTIDDNSWIGEGAWILNLEPVEIGRNVCISQDVLLCSGSHDRRSPTFEFDNGPIRIGDQVWVATRATVLRGVEIGQHSTIGACALVTSDVPPGSTVLSARGGVVTGENQLR